jgi:hypothetical protein
VTVNHSRYHYGISGVQLRKDSTDPVITADRIKAPFFWEDDFVLQTLSPTLLVVVASQNTKTIIQAYRLSAPFPESES